MRFLIDLLRLVLGLSIFVSGVFLAGANLNLFWEGFPNGLILMGFLLVFCYIGVGLVPSRFYQVVFWLHPKGEKGQVEKVSKKAAGTVIDATKDG